MAHRKFTQSLLALNIILLVLIPVPISREDPLMVPNGEPSDHQNLIAPIDRPDTVNGEVEGMMEHKTDPIAAANELRNQGIGGDLSQWIVVDGHSSWSPEELEMVRRALMDTFGALATIGLDGRETLDGYKFRRYDGEFVRDEQGLVALVNHGQMEIVLPDVAFLRLHGFSIYHEIGHALDNQLDRKMTILFHKEAQDRVGLTDTQSQTPYGYWLRPAAREGREEATADAFALWVTMDHVGMKRPIFAGMPLDVQYDGITQAIEQALILTTVID